MISIFLAGKPLLSSCFLICLTIFVFTPEQVDLPDPNPHSYPDYMILSRTTPFNRAINSIHFTTTQKAATSDHPALPLKPPFVTTGSDNISASDFINNIAQTIINGTTIPSRHKTNKSRSDAPSISMLFIPGTIFHTACLIQHHVPEPGEQFPIDNS